MATASAAVDVAAKLQAKEQTKLEEIEALHNQLQDQVNAFEPDKKGRITNQIFSDLQNIRETTVQLEVKFNELGQVRNLQKTKKSKKADDSASARRKPSRSF